MARPVRRILADIEFSAARLREAAGAGAVLAAVAALAWVAGLVTPAGGRPLSALLCATAAAAAAYLTARGVRAAAAVLLAAYVGAGIAVTAVAAHPFYVSYFFLVAGWRISGAWHAFRVPALVRELADSWTPREAQPGDVYTVRDGAGFGVVKVLAADPVRVHVRQYALRYPERPWHVKSSTLELPSALTGVGAHPHLPLDRNEFGRWEPALLRTEPLLPADRAALAAWGTLHGAPAGHPPPAA